VWRRACRRSPTTSSRASSTRLATASPASRSVRGAPLRPAQRIHRVHRRAGPAGHGQTGRNAAGGRRWVQRRGRRTSRCRSCAWASPTDDPSAFSMSDVPSRWPDAAENNPDLGGVPGSRISSRPAAGAEVSRRTSGDSLGRQDVRSSPATCSGSACAMKWPPRRGVLRFALGADCTTCPGAGPTPTDPSGEPKPTHVAVANGHAPGPCVQDRGAARPVALHR
jgi:hypothetical protein